MADAAGEGWVPEPGTWSFAALCTLLVVVVLLLIEGIHAWVRNVERKRLYERARDRARHLNRPLIVIGDPHNGVLSRTTGSVYGCGDICIDLTGCPRCPTPTIADDAAHALTHFEPDSSVVFISCVFEYVTHPEVLYNEALRVAGSNENLFVVHVHPNCLTAYFYKDGGDVARNVVVRGPPEHTLEWYRNPFS